MKGTKFWQSICDLLRSMRKKKIKVLQRKTSKQSKHQTKKKTNPELKKPSQINKQIKLLQRRYSQNVCVVFCWVCLVLLLFFFISAITKFKPQFLGEESELTTNIRRKECWNVEFEVAKAETPQGFVSQVKRLTSCSNWKPVKFSAHFIMSCMCNQYIPTVSLH